MTDIKQRVIKPSKIKLNIPLALCLYCFIAVFSPIFEYSHRFFLWRRCNVCPNHPKYRHCHDVWLFFKVWIVFDVFNFSNKYS